MPHAASAPGGPAAARGGYAEHAPPAGLGQHVECFWSRTADDAPAGAPRSHRVIPDGCVDIILTFAAPACPELGARYSSDPAPPLAALAVGAMTRPVVFRDSANVSYFAVRFRPGVAGVVFGVPASEITDQRVALGELWPDEDALFGALARIPDTGGRIRALSAAVARRVLAAPANPPASVLAATERIVGARGNLSIGALAADLGVTRQHLARSFARHVGVTPKVLARIVRARDVVRRVRHGLDADWIDVALDAGYYDQSHLIAEVKELTGLSPSAWGATAS